MFLQNIVSNTIHRNSTKRVTTCNVY